MNPFLINVQPCALTGRVGDCVSAEDLLQAESIQSLERAVRNNCAHKLRQVRQQMHQARHQAEGIRLAAREEANDLQARWQQEAKEEAMTQMLNWHCHEAEWTQAVMDNLHTRIAETIRDVLVAWTAEQDLSPFLIKRLTDKVCERVGQEGVILSVSADDHEAIARQFDGQMHVEVSKDLSQGQAELSSTALTARIDLTDDLERLLEAFVRKPAQQSIAT